jgi:predicted transcriptional regulator
MRNNPDDLANQCIQHIINWLNANIDEWKANDLLNDPKVEIKNAIAEDSADLKEKIELFMEDGQEF